VVKSLKARPILSLFNTYPKLVKDLAERLNKKLNPLEIICECEEEIKLNEDYKPFIKSLIHVFRNSVDHGIEDYQVRVEKGKDPAASISCIIESKDNGTIQIIIADDGSGIDLDNVKGIILEEEIYSAEELEKLSDEEILPVIFHDNFSTKEDVSDISGRGIGLGAVKAELDKLEGSVEIHSKKDKGTTFIFTLPIPSMYNSINKMDMDTLRKKLLKPVTRRAYEFISKDANVMIERVEDDICSECLMSECSCFDEHTIYFKTFGGNLDLIFAIQYDAVLIDKLMRILNYGEIYPDEEEELKLDTAKEIGNTIFGNAINYFPRVNQNAFLSIGMPFSQNTVIQRNRNVKILKSKIDTQYGDLKIYMIHPQSAIL
jgi:two-component system chemotaxis sensor kinase CheA